MHNAFKGQLLIISLFSSKMENLIFAFFAKNPTLLRRNFSK
jgi:hypothetical protein